jgi:hydrogenase maturation protease
LTTRTLVVCIGNDLIADDGVGHEIYRQLSKRALPSGVRVCLLGLGGIDLIDRLDGEELLIVVDALQLGQPAGTVRVLPWDDIPASDLRPVSGHGIGVREALQVCRRLYPEKAAGTVYLVGVEGSCFNEVGAGLTEAVRRAVPEAVERITELIGGRPINAAAGSGGPRTAPPE